MSVECYPITVLPHVSQIYRDFLAMGEKPADAAVRRWYGAEPFAGKWIGAAAAGADADRLADELTRQNESFGAGAAALENIEKLRAGARAVVTGQQVALFGGPLSDVVEGGYGGGAGQGGDARDRRRACAGLLAGDRGS